MNIETITTIALFAIIWESTKLVFRIGMTYFFQKEHLNAVKNNQPSVKDRLKVSNYAKKIKK